VEGRRLERSRERRTEKISGSRSMKIGSWPGRVERVDKSESGPPDWSVDIVVSKSLPPTLSLIRSLGRVLAVELEISFSIYERG